MKSIKLLYCLPSLHRVGGMEKVLTIKANYFSEKLGHKVIIVLTDNSDKKPFFKLSDLVTVINLNINFESIRNYPLLLRAAIYSYKQTIFKRKLKKILFDQKPDITISMLRREINFISKIRDGSKKIGEMQFNKSNYRDFNTGGNHSGIRGILAKIWMRQLINKLKQVNAFVVLSDEDLSLWKEINNITVIPNPIEKMPERISDCSSKNVLAAGRFVNQKGFDLLIQIWAIVHSRHSDWTLNIYGSGNKEPYIKLIDKLKLHDSCKIHNAIPDLTEPMCNSSIFAFSSRFEGFSLALTEAMSYGLPPVAFACPCGPKELIEDTKNGFLIKPYDLNDFADKICYLIENQKRRIEMSKMARKKAENYTIDQIATNWNKLFIKLLDQSQQN